jgi:hypothetical protein
MFNYSLLITNFARILKNIIVLFIWNNCNAQCGCCNSHILFSQNETGAHFSVKAIKKEAIRKVIITEMELDSSKAVLYETTVAQVQFDKAGYYTEHSFISNEIKTSRIVYKRNLFHKIRTSEEIYLGSDGAESNSLIPATTKDYRSSRWKLLIQDRNYKNEKLPISKASYILRNYDLKRREKYALRQTHYEYSPVYHVTFATKTVFYEKKKTGIRNLYAQDTLFGIDTIFYNNDWKEIQMKHYDLMDNVSSNSYNEFREYNSDGFLTYYKSENPTGISNSECPDSGNFELRYRYDENNLIQSIVYTFDDKIYVIKYRYE